MKWLAGVLCIITLTVWGGVIWTIAGMTATASDPAANHVSIDMEMTRKVTVSNYFRLPPVHEEESQFASDNNENTKQERTAGNTLEQYIGQVNPDESVSIDTLLEELGIETVAVK
ncbi:hypothetical protein SAMN04487944_11715 [Gracilibacillus ureilyticus]|uniref:Uncharacterized protein n=1 Tax=Gracilibacillus ureilyticus TaxID=531814 RepID=A0A1H9UCN5_9BACI|nr:hypothetical protein [Gracilibacillus ureilyticus]SES07109.1 hypothetical protein SAMN04487944_11715 [Gracilibacillus ureilyticus]